MSSEVEGLALVAAPVVLPVATVLGAGWLAWQGGKLLVEVNRAADRQIAEKKRQFEEAARHRKMNAVAAYEQLADMCSQIISQIESENNSIVGFAEIEQIKYDLKKICEKSLPDDAVEIEHLTSAGYLKLGDVVRKHSQITTLKLTESKAGLYRGISVADLMDDLRVAIAVMDINSTVGKDVKAADPVVLERVKLNEAFITISSRIMVALEEIEELTKLYKFTKVEKDYLLNCFSECATIIETLCKPTTSNANLKKGIKQLETNMEQYETLMPIFEKEQSKKNALYNIYVKVAGALGEKVENIEVFKSSKELEDALKFLEKRVEKAEECKKIYQKLGPAAYICYAWDQELQFMGYEVHTREKILEMASKRPQHAKLGDNKLPFYQWNDDELTQLYALTEECALQVIVHEDGAVTMQTIADADNHEVVATQHRHCSHLKILHERLRKNWFILYDFKENESPENVTTIAGWKASEDNAWNIDANREIVTDQRVKAKNKEMAQQKT